ncbi:polymorphic toxin-type HINT domain-containing protein, partial [Streptomyces sp. NPDC044948]|uniref:polymorphic toxin-type HINT domain-containing protein n=1 Tax=Streptomyces sp. NPDC044948 TaxID=3157092 RepID=UPI0033C8935C
RRTPPSPAASSRSWCPSPASNAASHARGAAAAAATDASKADAARNAAVKARAAAEGATKAADAADQAVKAAGAAVQAASSAAGAGANAAAAADAAVVAGQYAGQSSAAAQQARAAAASAHRQAAEANRAAGAAESLAGQAATAATEARDSARSAASHARKAADAAEDAAEHAGEAAEAAERSTAHAEAAAEAADAASGAAAKAKTVYTLARKIEAEELLTRTNAGIAKARDLKAEEEAAGKQRAEQAAAVEEARDKATELTRQAQEGASDDEVAGLGRQVALLDLRHGGPWLRAAAQTALGADAAGVVEYVGSGRADAQAQDDRTEVERLAEESAVKEVRDAAEAALDGDAAAVSAFLHEGQYTAGTEAFRVAVAQAADAGGPVVGERARQALGTGTTTAYRTFLTSTLAEAQEQDDRVTAAQLIDTGTPEVKAAARIALDGPAYLLHRFIESTQYTAQRKDLLALTHDQQVQQLVAEAAMAGAQAQKDAATANATAAKARNAAEDAQKWADKAKDSADLAASYATEADQHARDAEASARQAAESARTARAAAQRADKSAHQAAVSAADATLSANLAQNSAGSAWASAQQARVSAERAGKSATEAKAAALGALTATITKYREEAEQRRREAVAEKEAAEARGTTPAELYRCGLLGCEARDHPARYCQHNEVICSLAAIGPEAEAAGKRLWEFEKAVLGLSELENCVRKGDFNSCVQLHQDVLISAKFRALGVATRALRDLMRGCTQCFLPGTRVLLADGSSTPIEKVHVGDRVRATDPVTGETGARRVAQRIVTEKGDKHLSAITIRGPTGDLGTVTATEDHPFWSPSFRSWAPAGALRPGDSLRTDGGTEATVVATRSLDRRTSTYSLTVEGLHSFYVLAGGTPLLVHNSECKVLVLGVKEHVESETTRLNGYNFMDPKLEEVVGTLPDGTPYTAWMAEVENVMRQNGKISVSLKGFDPPGGSYQEKFDLALKQVEEGKWRSTEWEMSRLVFHNRVGNLDWDNITWWGDKGEKITIDAPKAG